MTPRIRLILPVALLLAGSAPAQETDDSVIERLQALERQVRDQAETIEKQQSKIERLEQEDGADPKRIEAAVDAFLTTKKEKGEIGSITAGWDKGPFIKSADDKFRLEIGGYGQFDFRAYQRGYAVDDTFLVREVRPEIRGHLWKDYQYRMQIELTGSAVTLMDAWINARNYEPVQLKVGQFKEPFGLDQLTGIEYLEFVERSIIADTLTPGRDVGVQVHGKPFDGMLDYAVGVFNGEGRNRGDQNDDKDFAGRVVLKPFKSWNNYWTKGFQVGVNATYGEQSHSVAGKIFQTAGDTTFLTLAPGTFHPEEFVRYGADFAWLIGPASLKGEWIRNVYSDLRRSGGRYEDFEAEGFYVSGSYLLTGEEKTFKNVVPAANFDPKEGGWGAWELAARGEWFEVNSDVIDNGFATGSEEVWAVTGGVNWYLNPHVRAMFDYEYTRFENDVLAGTALESDEHFFVVRVQFNF